MAAKIDNDLYNRISHTWWEDDSMISLLRSAINPVRLGYFREILRERGVAGPGRRLIDVGCGGGYLSEECAKMGFAVTGIDPSASTLAAASAHALGDGLSITYLPGTGESIPLPAASFDVAVCCDVLEHVSDLEKVVAEISRVLKPGGLFFFDTINRTPLSWLVMIKFFQDWPCTALMPKNLHVHRMFVKPLELAACCRRAGLIEQGFSGMGPGVGPLEMFRLLKARAGGKIGYRELGERAHFGRVRSLSISYLGYAEKGELPS